MESNTKSNIDTWLDANVFHEKKNGTFIECGANDGFRDSISYYFEKNHGWRGILIEPIPSMMAKCISNRSSDNEFFDCALSDVIGESVLTVPDDNLDNSSFDLSKKHIDTLEKGGFGKSYSQIKTKTIDCKRLFFESRFKLFDLAIFDVEGHENRILSSLMKCSNLPEILVVEYDWSDINELNSIVEEKYEVLATFKHDFVLKRR